MVVRLTVHVERMEKCIHNNDNRNVKPGSSLENMASVGDTY